MTVFIDIVRVGQEAHVFDDVRVDGHTVLESEGHDGDGHTLLAVRNGIALDQDLLELFRLEIRRVDDEIRFLAQRSQALTFFGNPLADAAMRSQGMDAARFLVAPYQSLIRGLDEDDFVGNAFGLEVFQALAHGIEKFTAPDIGDEGHVADPFAAFDA